MKKLVIDIETYSDVDLLKCGVYKYASSENFEILLFSYSVDGSEVQTVDVASNEKIPDDILKALIDENIEKRAYNVNFERVCLSAFLRRNYPELLREYDTYSIPEDSVSGFLAPSSWYCSQLAAIYLGLPLSLASVGEVLKIEEQKMTEGKRLIDYFSKPARNGTRHLPSDAPDKWETYKAYNKRDVEAEMAIDRKVERFPVPQSVWDEYHLSEEINDRGIQLDMDFVSRAIAADEQSRTELTARLKELTGLENPNSVAQMKQWLADNGVETESLGKADVQELLKAGGLSPEIEEVLLLRQQSAKSSVKKYTAMQNAVGEDGRARGMFFFYGANRTGRFCLTGDHEVLTENGWCRLDEWNGGTIACWTPNGEIVSFQKSKALSFPYTGIMYEYEDKRISQISTPEHKMYVKQRYDKPWTVDTVENMAKYRPSIPFTGYRQTTSGMEHNKLRILVMIQADGHYKQDGSIVLAFTKLRKVERCKKLLRASDISFAYKIYEEQSKTRHQFTINSRDVPLWLRLFRNKTFGTWLFDESADVFFDELVYWDGYQSAKNSIQYVTCNKQNADIVQAFAHISGRTAQMRVKVRNTEHPNWNDAYYLDIWLTPKNCHEIRVKPTKNQFSGTVYCAETKTGFFLVRRNGKVWVTGNSGRLIQLQNLPQNHITDLAEARALVKSGDYKALQMLYDNIPDTLSQLVRTAFVPKQGMKFIVADFSAIEARVIAWLAGEQWRMNAFANGEDIYCASASKMFGVPVVKHGVNGHLRQKGKVAELACGYGGSVGAMKAMGGSDLGLSDEELKQIVTDWRTASPNIVKLWWDVDNAVKKAVRKKEITATHGLQFSYQSGILFIRLPSGRSLAYVKPRIEENAFGGESITYEGVGATKKWERIESYGPKFVENCLAKGTLVITDCGLIPIEKITDDMKIWDGVEWVSHDGLIVQGRKDTINVDGIRMTPEHKILTKKGWIECGKAEGFNWSDVSLPDRSSKGRGQQAGENAVALQMCLWESDCCFSKKSKSGEIPTKILWVHEKRINQQGKYNAWNEPSSCLECLAFDETALYRLESSCISQLWWQRDFCVSALDGKFRELLVGYGRNVAERTGHRQDRQQQGVQPRKLSLGNQKAEQQKQTKQSNGNNLIRKDDTLGTFRKDWDWSNNTTLSPESWMESRIVIDRTRFQEYVYDIRNCGSRHRFAVWNGKRACIVSNCVQGIARDLLMNSMMALRSCFIVAHIHDELIIEADKRMSLEVLCEQMARVPDWAEGLLLRADGYECEFYRKD